MWVTMQAKWELQQARDKAAKCHMNRELAGVLSVKFTKMMTF